MVFSYLLPLLFISKGESKDGPWGGRRGQSDVCSARRDLTSVSPHLQNSNNTNVIWLSGSEELIQVKVKLKPDHSSTVQSYFQS